jgi:rod shape-determining protein MreD
VRNAALITLGFLLLVFQAALSTLIPIYAFAPNLVLPVVIYLGVTHEVHVVRGAVLAFILGYLLDAFCGSPMGLHTFILVATFIVARFAGLRFLMRGVFFQAALTFVVALLDGGTILALRAIFEKSSAWNADSVESTALTLLIPALSTALVAPVLFAVVRKIEGALVRRRDDKTVLR